MRKEELKRLFPNLAYYSQLKHIPSHLVSKTQLVKEKKWREGIEPIAIKGNSQVGNGYYFLYDARSFDVVLSD